MALSRYQIEHTAVTQREVEWLIEAVRFAYEDRLALGDPEEAADWQERRDLMIQDLRELCDPSNQPYAGPLLVILLESVLMCDILGYAIETHDLQESLEAERRNTSVEREEAMRLGRENSALRQEIERLKQTLPKHAQTVTVDVPAQVISLRSALQQEIVRLMGADGLGRSWRIIQRVVASGLAEENSVRNALRKLTQKGLVDDYGRHGRPVRWKITAGGNRRLVLLTEMGKRWYSGAFGHEAVESEIEAVARRHRSAAHGVGILEARDYLRDAGYLVDDDPGAILIRAEERWGGRTEPDLIVTKGGDSWPVEVQREVSERMMSKWVKALSLAGSLALVLFNEESRLRQEIILERAVDLSTGSILLTSLEAMEAGDWKWSPVRPIGR